LDRCGHSDSGTDAALEPWTGSQRTARPGTATRETATGSGVVGAGRPRRDRESPRTLQSRVEVTDRPGPILRGGTRRFVPPPPGHEREPTEFLKFLRAAPGCVVGDGIASLLRARLYRLPPRRPYHHRRRYVRRCPE